MKKSAKQELERDEFMEASERLVEWGMANRDRLLVIVAVALIAIVAVTFVRRTSEQGRREQMEAFSAAFESYNSALGNPDADARAEAMAEAGEQFADFARDADGDLGQFALYMEGNSYFYRGASEENYRKAAELFERYAARAGSKTARARGFLAAGYARESLMFMADDSKLAQPALDAFKKAADLGGKTWVAADAKLGQARILANLEGRASEALPLIESVKKERGWEAPFELLRDVEMNDEERRLLTDAMFTIDEYGLRQSAEILEARIKGQLAR